MSVTLAGMTLRSPVLVAAGCGGTGRELAGYGPLDALGAFVTRTITLEPRAGAPAGCVAESPSGLVHATGLPNPGVDHFLATELPWLVSREARVIVSVAARTTLEMARLAGRLARAPGVSAVEVLPAPVGVPGPAEVDGLLRAVEPFEAAALVASVQRELPPGVPVLAKLRCETSRLVETARAVADAGAAAVVLGEAQQGLLPDGRPAGLSGPAVRPQTLAGVAAVRAALPHLDVVGCGGVATAADVAAFRRAGAVAVAVGTALLHDPTTAHRLVDDLREDPS